MAFALRLGLINHHSNNTVANAWWFIIAVPSSLVCVILFLNEFKAPERRPHLTVVFSTADEPRNRVELTNSFLALTNFNVDEISGDLVVPKRLDQDVVNFKFGIRNDSLEAVAEYNEVSIILPKEWLCLPDGGWKPGDPVGKNEMQSWVCEPPALLPGRGEILPDIQVSVIPGLYSNQFFPVAIRACAKDSPDKWLAFSVYFWPPSTNLPSIARPFVVFEPRQPNGLRRFSVSMEKLKEFQQ